MQALQRSDRGPALAGQALVYPIPDDLTYVQDPDLELFAPRADVSRSAPADCYGALYLLRKLFAN